MELESSPSDGESSIHMASGSTGMHSSGFYSQLDFRLSLTDFGDSMDIPDYELADSPDSPDHADSSSDSTATANQCTAADRNDQSRADSLAAKRRKEYRVKKRNELLESRAMVVELTHRLGVLARRNEASKKRHKLLGSEGIASKGWRGVAFRQLQRRIEAETLNRDLRFQIRQCKGAAQVLAQSWRDQLQAFRNRVPSELFTTPPQLAFDTRDMAIIAAMLEDIQAAYIRADDILSAYKPPSNARQPYCWEHIWHDDPQHGSRYLEFIEQWEVPFALHDAVPAMRNALPVLLAKGSTPAFFQVPGVNQGDALKFTYSCEDADGEKVAYRSIFVSRGFVEADRVVICWRSVSEEVGTVGAPPIQFNEHGWGVLAQTPDQGDIRPSLVGTNFTLCANVNMFRPSPLCSESSSEDHFGKYARTMLEPSEKDTVDCYEAIENAVMDRHAAFRVHLRKLSVA